MKRKQRDDLTIDYINKLIRYENGKLFWLKRPIEHFVDYRAWKIWNTRYSGKECGNIVKRDDPSKTRYQICVNGIRIYRYHLIWALFNNCEINVNIDHINGNQLDDRIENLRIANQCQNLMNTKINKRNKSGYKGISWDKSRNLWCSEIKANKKRIRLGRFKLLEDAVKSRADAEVKYQGEFSSGASRK